MAFPPPEEPILEGTAGPPVPVRYVGRGSGGTPLFQIAGQRGFIRREDAIAGLRWDFENQRLVDAFGTRVPQIALRLPEVGRTFTFIDLTARWEPLTGNPKNFAPEANQEIVERLVLIRRDGSLEVVESSMGAGNKYDTAKTGGWWRAQTSAALGLSKEERPPTKDLQAAVASKQILVKTWRSAR